MSSVLWGVGAIVVCAVLLYVAYAIEPHWVAKDGRSFLTTSEVVDETGRRSGAAARCAARCSATARSCSAHAR